MILIIAEKPSLARNIIAGIGDMEKKDGYYEGMGYIITYAFGHLFSLYDVEEYDEYKSDDNHWNMDKLPCFPKEFKFGLKKNNDKKIDLGVKKQFGIINKLINRNDVSTIVNAGDADREGEIIVRLIISNSLKTKKELKRLWLPDQTAITVKKALMEMKDEKEYDNLANEGLARTYIDWLYGVNLTRYATIKSGILLRVGRVIIPIVKAIYDRDKAIKEFVVEKYYALVSKAKTNGEEIELTSELKFDKNSLNKANEKCDEYNNSKCIVVSKKVKKDVINPSKLYSLTKLQNVLGKKYKMSMDESLRIVQGLYEKGYVTYPRTNSEYLATNEKEKIKSILENVKKLGYPVIFKDKKSIFDDSKIESHSALTPTYKIPKKEQLSEKEMVVYQTIFRRFVAVFCSLDAVCNKTEIKVKVGDYEEFSLKGTEILDKGWMKYDDANIKDKILPNLNEGDIINTIFEPKEKETTPPKHYTIETLNNYLKNPFKDEKKQIDESDDDDYKAIFDGLELGTEATRTGIIENAIKSKYIELKKDVYYILSDGIYLIDSLLKMGISMDKYKTSTLGQALKKVYHNDMSIDDSINLAISEIKEVFENKNNIGKYKDYVGICPKCGNNIIKGKYNYGCMGYKNGCDFKIGFTICSHILSIDEAKILLEKGKTNVINDFISKNNKQFSAKLRIENAKVVFDFNK